MDSFSSLDEGMYLYGVFDGHDGSRASNFTAQRMPAEILLGQIGSTTEDSEVQEVLRQVCVEILKNYPYLKRKATEIAFVVSSL